jgi:predicted nucleotidyltransferase
MLMENNSMRREEIIDTLVQHRQDLAIFGIRRLALFGSVARNEARHDSDVDVLVEFEGTPTFDRYADLNFYLENLLRHSVDLITSNSLRDFMRPSVEQDAVDVSGLSTIS